MWSIEIAKLIASLRESSLRGQLAGVQILSNNVYGPSRATPFFFNTFWSAVDFMTMRAVLFVSFLVSAVLADSMFSVYSVLRNA